MPIRGEYCGRLFFKDGSTQKVWRPFIFRAGEEKSLWLTSYRLFNIIYSSDYAKTGV
jgi:hypothetical protein